MPIMNRRVHAERGDGPWYGPQGWWRSKTADENIDTRQYRHEDALQLAPVVSAVMVLSKMAASSEMVVERMTPEGEWERTEKGLPDWASPVRRPNPYQSRGDFLKMLSISLLVYGNALAVRGEKPWMGSSPAQLTAFPWWSCSVTAGTGRSGMRMTGEEVLEKDNMRDWGVPGFGGTANEISYGVEGRSGLKALTSLNPGGDVIHFKYSTLGSVLFGQSPLMWASQALRTAVAADAYAEMSFQMGFSAFGMLAHKGGKPGEGMVKGMRKYLSRAGRNPRTRFGPYITSGEWNYHRFGVSPEELQLLTTRRMAFNTAAALTGVGPELLGSPEARVSGSGIRYSQQALARLHGRDFLMMLSEPLSEAMPDDYRVRLVPTGLSEMDPLEQSKVDDRLLRVGVLKPSEVRQHMGLPSIEGLNEEVCPQIVGTTGGGDGDEPGPDVGTPEETPTTPGGEMV